MSSKVARIHYHGSIFWLLFWCIFFFPIAFAMLLTSGEFVLNQKSYMIKYDGSKFWLCFWVLFFFLLSLVLLFVNGVALVTDQNE